MEEGEVYEKMELMVGLRQVIDLTMLEVNFQKANKLNEAKQKKQKENLLKLCMHIVLKKSLTKEDLAFRSN